MRIKERNEDGTLGSPIKVDGTEPNPQERIVQLETQVADQQIVIEDMTLMMADLIMGGGV